MKKQNANLLISPYYDFLIPKNIQFNVIITIHDLCYYELDNLYKIHTKIPSKIFLKNTLNYCSGVFTVSETSKKIIKFYFPNIFKNKKIIVIYNSFSKPLQKTKKNQLPSKYITIPGDKILYTGGFENRKNLSRLFLAFNHITKEHIDLRLIITGNLKNNKKFNKLIHSYGINDNVILTGTLTDEEMCILYQSDIIGAVNLSLCEGFGRNSYEAFLFGIPILCSNIEINHEIVGNYPIYCDPNDIQNIIKGFEKLLKNPNRKKISYIEERFTLDYNYHKFSKLINECIK